MVDFCVITIASFVVMYKRRLIRAGWRQISDLYKMCRSDYLVLSMPMNPDDDSVHIHSQWTSNQAQSDLRVKSGLEETAVKGIYFPFKFDSDKPINSFHESTMHCKRPRTIQMKIRFFVIVEDESIFLLFSIRRRWI